MASAKLFTFPTRFPDPIEHALAILDGCRGDFFEAAYIVNANCECDRTGYWNQVAIALAHIEPAVPFAYVDGEGSILLETDLQPSQAEATNRLLRSNGYDQRWMLLYSPKGTA
jgi:hypothetical protein